MGFGSGTCGVLPVGIELVRGMGTDDTDLGMRLYQLPEPDLIVSPLQMVFPAEMFKYPKPWRAPWVLWIHFLIVEVSVTGMEYPALGAFDGDAAMPGGVAFEGDEQHLIETGHRPYREETVPRLALRSVKSPLRAMPEMAGTIPRAMAERFGIHRRVMLRRVNMDARSGEIGQPSGMIEVEMGQNNVPHILGFVSQPGDPGQRRRCGITIRMGEEPEPGTKTAVRIGDILRSQSGIHEDETFIALDQQTMTDEMAPFEQTPPAVHQP